MRNLKLSVFVLLTCGALMLMPASCATSSYVLHPGSANIGDSQAYDALQAAQTVIDLARPAFAAGTLPANLKPLMNQLIHAYDVARPVWLAYHAVAVGNPAADATALTQPMKDLAAALAAYKKGA